MLDQILKYTIPVAHPVVVHFPLALGLAALIFVAGWAFRDKLFWLYASMWLTALAWIGSILALRTGEVMEEQSEGVAIVDELVHLHETMGERAAWALGLTLLWLLFSRWHSSHDIGKSGTRLWIRLVALLLMVSAGIFLVLTGHLGGVMTWGVPS